MKSKEPFSPRERHETIRHAIISVLEGQTLSARDISGYVAVSEKEIYEHLAHIQKTRIREKLKLIILPAKCKKCGFVFKKRERIKKPGKCPHCRSESIEEPLYTIN